MSKSYGLLCKIPAYFPIFAWHSQNHTLNPGSVRVNRECLITLNQLFLVRGQGHSRSYLCKIIFHKTSFVIWLNTSLCKAHVYFLSFFSLSINFGSDFYQRVPVNEIDDLQLHVRCLSQSQSLTLQFSFLLMSFTKNRVF